ncbi:hypothetical protein VNO77_25916 [Canavalia gladiata]|uniref:Uncharacterized protein n=1 Tax=Canavalia gladiata TaxID=3824 RepID=A0AAN9KSV6_CANGL
MTKRGAHGIGRDSNNFELRHELWHQVTPSILPTSETSVRPCNHYRGACLRIAHMFSQIAELHGSCMVCSCCRRMPRLTIDTLWPHHSFRTLSWRDIQPRLRLILLFSKNRIFHAAREKLYILARGRARMPKWWSSTRLRSSPLP